jgi:hypothetical protein
LTSFTQQYAFHFLSYFHDSKALLLALNNTPLAGYNTIYVSTHILKVTVVAYVLATMNKIAPNCMCMFLCACKFSVYLDKYQGA